GFVDTSDDAVLLVEAVHRNMIPRLQARLTAEQRAATRSGSVYIFDEEEAGIKRWTDQYNWSPSRIHHSTFLIYRELEKIPGGELAMQDEVKEESTALANNPSISSSSTPNTAYAESDSRLAQPAFTAQLKNNMQLKPNGLVKKTFSIKVYGRQFHLVSYYYVDDVQSNLLQAPSQFPELATITPTDEIKDQ
ncbi:gluconate transport inducer 1/Pac2, partial [Polychytrium aggregatum]|uniref:gluconate transport inducer 1/Pac2 n=1 Tax=Polychytrium aggregatum TaxID=110093 RepID=UPI0022FDF746